MPCMVQEFGDKVNLLNENGHSAYLRYGSRGIIELEVIYLMYKIQGKKAHLSAYIIIYVKTIPVYIYLNIFCLFYIGTQCLF